VYTRVIRIGIASLPLSPGRVPGDAILLEGRDPVGDHHGVSPHPRAVLALVCGVHFLHDGFSDILYVLLPLWAAEFGLSFARVGLVRAAYTGAMALFQIPAGVLAERLGERHLLAAGTALTGLAFIAATGAFGFLALLLLLIAAGLGSGVQHPLSSSIVSRAYESGRRRAALGMYNFAGDLGKVAVPAAVGVAAATVGWRLAGAVYGVLGLLVAGAIVVGLGRLGAGDAVPAAAPEGEDRARGWGIRDRRGFRALAAIGMIDNATRTAFLTFLPFVLIAKGLTVAGVGGALALVFAGGATGKFVCGFMADRVGVIRTVVVTEAATAVGIATLVVAPLPVALALLLPIGIALNGTSSVLYGSVADLVHPERRARAYGLYYTLSVGASAVAPVVYGLVSDVTGVAVALVITAALVTVTIPLSLVLRPAIVAPAGA
jgi:MFS transporter, FSR family, fosmidomycin resistance protein